MPDSHALSMDARDGMHPQRRSFAWINVVGGLAVLGSYAWCLGAYPALRGDFWGGVPEALQGFYTLNMLLAAAGYFFFTRFVFLDLDPGHTRIGSFGFGLFNVLYAVMLVGSAAWMPLTLVLLQSPSTPLWWLVRVDLLAVGAASLGIGLALLRVRPGRAPRSALLGAAFFCLQTAVLDALVWPAYFPHP